MKHTKYKYENIEDGVEYPVSKEFMLQCCDCSLVHKINFRVKGKKLFMAMIKDVDETKKARKGD